MYLLSFRPFNCWTFCLVSQSTGIFVCCTKCLIGPSVFVPSVLCTKCPLDQVSVLTFCLCTKHPCIKRPCTKCLCTNCPGTVIKGKVALMFFKKILNKIIQKSTIFNIECHDRAHVSEIKVHKNNLRIAIKN